MQYKDLKYREEKVYDVVLNIMKPFDAANKVANRFIDHYQKWTDKHDRPSWHNEAASMGEIWDKNRITAEDFADRMRRDIENGTSNSWTSIPDSMTDYLKHLGYDGIKDIGGKNGGMGHTVWIPFSSEQVKSADPVTYDDAGNVIPLSERFNTSSDDIRYSDKTDSEGNLLTKAQQEYFADSAVLDENGKLKVMYHGTSSFGFNVFDWGRTKFGLFGSGFYFTDNLDVADGYTGKGKGSSNGIYDVYLNITNPLDKGQQIYQWYDAFEDFGIDTAYLDDCTTNEDAFRALKNYMQDEHYIQYDAEDTAREIIESMGYDGITHMGGGRYGNGEGPAHRVYIAFDSNQIKSVDNQKPTGNDDIRYSDRDQKRFEDQVEAIRNNNYDRRSNVYMGSTPSTLTNILSIPSMPMMAGTAHIYSIALTEEQARKENRSTKGKYFHNLGWDFVKEIPRLAGKPRMIIKSKNDPNDASFAVVTDRLDSQ